MLKDRRKMVVIWSAALAVVTLVIIGVFMKFWLDTRDLQIADEEAARVPDNVRIVSKFVSPGETEVLDLVQRALAIRDPAKVDALFRTGAATPGQVVEFLVGSAARDGRVLQSDWLQSMDIDGLLLEGVLVTYELDHTRSARLAFLTPDDAGVWKVDFEAFARSSRPPWKDFMEGRAERAVVRVIVARDTYFNWPFQDDSQWACFGIASPELPQLMADGQDMVRGYCRVGSAQEKALSSILTDDNTSSRAVMEIRRVEGAEARQFEITRVLAREWVLPPKSFDEKFN
jgi:hypothetical protein